MVANSCENFSPSALVHIDQRGGAQIHEPGAGKTCLFRFQADKAILWMVPSGSMTHAQSALRSSFLPLTLQP